MRFFNLVSPYQNFFLQYLRSEFTIPHPFFSQSGAVNVKLVLGLATVVFAITGYIFFGQGLALFNSSSSHDGKEGETRGAGPRLAADLGSLPHVQVSKPQRKDIVASLEIPGDVFAWEQATLYAKISGYLKWIGVDKGDAVKEGERVAEIESPEIQELYEQAEADYKIKQLTADRLFAVWKKNPDVVAKQEVDLALSAATAAKHIRNKRKILFDYRMIYAPFSGIVTARFVDPGAMIQTAAGSANKNNPLVTVMNFEQVRIYFNIPEKFSRYVQAGLSVGIQINENGRERISMGTIARTTKSLDPITRTLIAEVDMSNENHQLRPGMSIMGTLYLQEHKNALAIPPDSIISAGEDKTSKYVFIVENGKARRIPVRLGIDDGVSIEVIEGLAEGDEVVVVGKSSIVDGVKVATFPYTLPAGQRAKQKF